MKSQEVHFQKSQKLLASRAGSIEADNSPYSVYVAAIEIEWIAMGCSE